MNNRILRSLFKFVLIPIFIAGIALYLMITQINLCKTSDRNHSTYLISGEMKQRINKEISDIDSQQDIINYGADLTTELLTFSRTNDIDNGKANCVGYAQLTSAIINYAFQVKKLPYRAKPVVGKVYLFGIDLNNMAQKILPKKHRPFFKDHDFVEIDLGNEIIYIDSSLQDITGLNFFEKED